jgi:hypothetical protein
VREGIFRLAFLRHAGLEYVAARDEQLLHVGIGVDGAVAAIWGVHAPRRSDFDWGFRLTIAEVQRAGQTRRIPLEPIEDLFPFPHIQPLRNGWLLALSTRAIPDKPNAILFDDFGRAVGRFSIGDGIADALVDDMDTLWVSYFDEGVFGGGLFAPSGLCRFDPGGNLLWANQLAPIDDCYALNVVGNEAWAYYYSAWGLLHVGSGGESSVWPTDVEGAGAVLVSNDLAAIFGGWSHQRAAGVWRLGSDTLVERRPIDRDIPDGVDFFKAGKTCRGNRMYLVQGPEVYVASLQELV